MNRTNIVKFLFIYLLYDELFSVQKSAPTRIHAPLNTLTHTRTYLKNEKMVVSFYISCHADVCSWSRLRMARMNEEMRDSEGVFGAMGE